MTEWERFGLVLSRSRLATLESQRLLEQTDDLILRFQVPLEDAMKRRESLARERESGRRQEAASKSWE